MSNDDASTPQQRVDQAQREVEQILRRYGCSIVPFIAESEQVGQSGVLLRAGIRITIAQPS